MTDRTSLTIPQLSGLWRRFGAMFTDGLVLTTVGIAVGGLQLGGWCASVGVFAQLIGLAAAILYTAVLNSRIGGGQTVGKALFAIQVIGADAQPVPFARSLVRSVVLWIALAQPPMIRDIALQSGSAAVVIASFFLAGAVGLGVFYLLLFNRHTRQGLHDLIAATFVVKKGAVPYVIAAPLPRVHWYVLAGLFVLLAGAVILQTPPYRRDVTDFQHLEQQLRQVEQFHQLRDFEVSGKTLEINVQLKRLPESFEAVQYRVAGIVLSAYPAADRLEQMKVTVSCTCDLGVLGRLLKWGVVLKKSRNAPVADWRRLAPR